MKQHIFISYARKDGASYADYLEYNLLKLKFSVWRDKRKIDPSKDFTAEIEQAIRESSVVIVCVTKDTQREDSFVRREIQYSILAKKPIIVGIFDAEVLPPIHVINNTWFDFYSDKSKALRQLEKYLHENIETSVPEFNELSDPYRPYLEQLYDRIVDFLNYTVITLIDLESEYTPQAVSRKDMFEQLYISQGLLPNNKTILFNRFTEAFDHYDGRLLLLGNPGAGKSVTLMSYCRDLIADRLSNAELPIPFLGIIPTWDIKIQHSIPAWISEGYTQLSLEMVEQAVENHEAVLLLDGLDELGSRASRLVEKKDKETGKVKKETEWFDPRLTFINKLPNIAKTLVTCRIKDYEEIGEKVKLNGAVTLRTLNDKQIVEYLGKDVDLHLAIENDPALREMLRTPLLMSLFAFAYRDQGADASKLRNLRHSLGELRAEIIKTYTEKRFLWDSKKHSISFSYNELIDILKKIALENSTQKQIRENIVTRADFTDYVAEDNVEKFITLCRRLHFIVYSNDTFRFIHLLVRDYFVYLAAVPLLQSAEMNDRVRGANALARIRDDRGIVHLINALPETNSRVSIAIADAFIRIGEPSIPLLIKQIKHTDYLVRRSISTALSEIGTIEILDTFHELLLDDDNKVRLDAIISLGKLRSRDSIKNLVDCFRNSDTKFRAHVLKALRKINDIEAVAVKELTEIFLESVEDVDPEVYRRLGTLFRSSGKLGKQAFKHIAKSSNPTARSFVIKYYPRADRKGFATLLSAYLDDNRSDRFRRKISNLANRALSKTNSKEARQALEKWRLSANDDL